MCVCVPARVCVRAPEVESCVGAGPVSDCLSLPFFLGVGGEGDWGVVGWRGVIGVVLINLILLVCCLTRRLHELAANVI